VTHHLFNIVTNKVGYADAILIRGVEPIIGAETMLKRAGKRKTDFSITNGPGKLSNALGIKISHNGMMLDSQSIWIEQGEPLSQRVIKTTRIGVDYAGEDAKLPWRFYIKNNKFVSKY